MPAVDGADAQLTAVTDVERHDQDLVLALRKQAQQQWHETGHPGWQLVPASTRIETLLPQKLASYLSLVSCLDLSSLALLFCNKFMCVLFRLYMISPFIAPTDLQGPATCLVLSKSSLCVLCH